MADKVYKLKDIPKGQRLAHIWDYYKWQIIITILFVLACVSLVTQNLNKEKYDSYILFTMSGGQLLEETSYSLETGIEDLGIDNNGDSYNNLYISTVLFPEDMLSPVTAQESQANMQRLVAELTAGECIIQITDDKLYVTFSDNKIYVCSGENSRLIDGTVL